MVDIAEKACITPEYMRAIACGRVPPPPAPTRKRIIDALGAVVYRDEGRGWVRDDLHYLAAEERRNCAKCDEREWCGVAKTR
jgi:hypothetical protein